MLRRLAVCLLLLIVGACSPPLALPPQAGAQNPQQVARALSDAEVLRPFEDRAAIPAQIALLPFEEGRAYAILVRLPAPAVVDLSDPERARRGLVQFLNPLLATRAGTLLARIIHEACIIGHKPLFCASERWRAHV